MIGTRQALRSYIYERLRLDREIQDELKDIDSHLEKLNNRINEIERWRVAYEAGQVQKSKSWFTVERIALILLTIVEVLTIFWSGR